MRGVAVTYTIQSYGLGSAVGCSIMGSCLGATGESSGALPWGEMGLCVCDC